MWDYSDTVKEHFFNPRNAGEVEGANAVGDVGSISCGDALRLMLKVDPETETIQAAGFQTFGCGSAIASSSALTEMVIGKTLDDALTVTNQDIADFLDGLPPEKMHCSVMGREALQAAIADYRGEEWSDDHEEGALVCKCFAIDEALIERTVKENGLTTLEQVTHYTKAGGSCATCHEAIEDVLDRVLGVNQAPPVSEPEPRPAVTGLQRIKRIEATLEALRPQLQADHGDVELVEVIDNTIYVTLTGACSGCQMASMTLSGIQQRLMEELGSFIRVLPASQLPKQAVGT